MVVYVSFASDLHLSSFIIIIIIIVTQTLMTVLDSHARMVEIVQMRLMISIVIVFPDTQAKTVPSVRKITFIIDFLNPPQLGFFSCLVFLLLVILLFWVLFVRFIKLFFTSCLVNNLTTLWLNLTFPCLL